MNIFKKTYNYLFNKEKQECFICCSIDGKTNSELLYEMQFNQKYLNYPLISLCDVYNCRCKNIYAHNKCIICFNKCPTCRKQVIKPNVYVKTKYDYYLKYLLEWIKKDISRIIKIQHVLAILNIFCVIILFLLDKKYIYIPAKTYQSLIFGIIVGLLQFLFGFYVLLDDYFKKYWLYVPKQNKCYAL